MMKIQMKLLLPLGQKNKTNRYLRYEEQSTEKKWIALFSVFYEKDAKI